MPTENTWVVPSVANLTTVMEQLVLNAGEKNQNAASGMSRGAVLLNTVGIARIRAAIRAAGKVPLSSLASSVPPEAEAYAYVLTVDAMTASKPNMAGVVMMPNGTVVSPWMTLVKDAKAWVEAVAKGRIVTPPDSPALVGVGGPLAPVGTLYPAAGSYTANLVVAGYTYYWTPGANETSLTNGATVLTAAGSFTASTQSVTITGVAAGLAMTGLLQHTDVQANLARSGRIVGEVNTNTPGPGEYNWLGLRPGQQGYGLENMYPDCDRGFW